MTGLTSQNPYQSALKNFLECESELVDLTQIPQWKALVERTAILQRDKPKHTKTLLHAGYFYNLYTEVPNYNELRFAISRMKALGAYQIIVPSVRATDNTDSLESIGFEKIASDEECIFSIKEDVDTDLLKRIGKHRLRQIKRIAKKADEAYTFTIYDVENSQPNDEDLLTLARLHKKHANRFGNPRNYFSIKVLNSMINSSLKSNLILVYRACKLTNMVIHVSVMIKNKASDELQYVSQAMDYENIPSSQNLYVASIYRVYHYAIHNGFKYVNLGRGGRQSKERLGADTFYKQNHWRYLNQEESKKGQVQKGAG